MIRKEDADLVEMQEFVAQGCPRSDAALCSVPIPDDEPDPPADLILAWAALPEKIRANINAQLMPYDDHRNARLPAATTALAESLAKTPYCTYDHIYHLLRDCVLGFGFDESAKKPYIAFLPRLIATAIQKAETNHKLTGLVRKQTSSPNHPSLAPAGISFAETVCSYTPEIPAGALRPEVLDYLHKHHRFLLVQADKPMFRVLKADGYYSESFVPLSHLETELRTSGNPGDLQLSFTTENGTFDKKAKHLISEYGTLTHGEVMVFGHQGAIVTRDQGSYKIGISPIKFNSQLRPVYDAEVDHWLRLMFDTDLEEALRAVLMLGRPQDGPTATVALWGASNAGKNMLVRGITEWFTPHGWATSECLTTDYTDDLLRYPIIHIEEGFHVGKKNGADALRRLTGGGEMFVNPKGKGKIVVKAIHRAVITSNNLDFIDQAFGDRSLSQDDIDALKARMAFFRVRPEAAHFLASKAGQAYTQGWVARPDGQSDYRVAQHLLHELHRLYKFDERGKLILPPGRFLYNPQALSEDTKDHFARPRTEPEMAAIAGICALFSRKVGTKIKSLLADDRIEVYTGEVMHALAVAGIKHPCTSVYIGRALGTWATATTKAEGYNRFVIPFSRLRPLIRNSSLLAEGPLHAALNN